MFIFICILFLLGYIFFVPKKNIKIIILTISLLIILIIPSCCPLIKENLNRWFLHNKWNHSDWATFLAGVLGFSGAFVALYGVRWQVTREEKNKIKGLIVYIKIILNENLNKKIWEKVNEIKYLSSSYAIFEWVSIKDFDFFLLFSEEIINNKLDTILGFPFGENFFQVYYKIKNLNETLKKFYEELTERRKVFLDIMEQNELSFEIIDELYNKEIPQDEENSYYLCIIIAVLSRAIGEVIFVSKTDKSIKTKKNEKKITEISMNNLKKSLEKIEEIKKDLAEINFYDDKFETVENFLLERNLDSFCNIIQKCIEIIIEPLKEEREKRELCGKLRYLNFRSKWILNEIDSIENELKEKINKILTNEYFKE